MPVAVVVSAGLLTGGLLFSDHQASFQGFLASIVALYSAAAYADGRERILGAAAVAVSLAGYQLAEVVRGNDVGEMPGIWLPYLVAFALGRARGWQLDESRRLRQRAAVSSASATRRLGSRSPRSARGSRASCTTSSRTRSA